MNFNNIKAIAFDFDGVFTNNLVIVSEDGKESVICNRSDGIGIELIRELGIPMKIISSERNPVVAHRAKKLKLPCVHGVKIKTKELDIFAKSLQLEYKNIAFLGNDTNDLECMVKVGFPIAVADAVDEIKNISNHVLNEKGGMGAIRELSELIYKSYNNV